MCKDRPRSDAQDAAQPHANVWHTIGSPLWSDDT